MVNRFYFTSLPQGMPRRAGRAGGRRRWRRGESPNPLGAPSQGFQKPLTPSERAEAAHISEEVRSFLASSDAAFTQRHAEPSSSFIYEHDDGELMTEIPERLTGGGAAL